MVQCPDCEEKDKIVIAGKVFCANCGTPWQPSNSANDKVEGGDTQKTPPVLSTPKKVPIPPTASKPSAQSTPMKVKNIAPQRISNKTPLLPPKPPIAAGSVPQKIDNIEDKLRSLKTANQPSVRPDHKNELIVKEIAGKLAGGPVSSTVDSSDPQSIRPVIPHSPIGDLEEDQAGTLLKSDAGQLDNLSKSPLTIDDKVLSENTDIIQATPIPSERIQEVVNEVIANRQPAKKAAPQAVLSDQFQPPDTSQMIKSVAPGSPTVAVKSRQQKYVAATAVPQSSTINKFQSSVPIPDNAAGATSSDQTQTPLASTPIPLPPKPTQKASPSDQVLSSESAQKSQTFSQLASVIPIKQPGPMKVANENEVAANLTNQTAKSPSQWSPSATSPAEPSEEALKQLSNMVGSTSDTPDSSPVNQTATGKSVQQAVVEAAVTALPTAPATGEETEHIGSEMVSLDSKDESVISDDEFSQLAEVKPTISTPTTTETNSQADQSLASDQASISKNVVDLRNVPAETEGQPKAVKPLDIAATVPTASQPSKAPVTPPTNQVSKVFKQDTATALPPSPDGITPGVSFKPSHAVDYPVFKAPVAESQSEDKPLTEEEALKLVHERATEKANLPQPKVGHSFSASSIGLSMVGLILVGAYIWQINYPSLAFKVAAGKAGISASSPSYIPSGWKLSNNIKTSPGVVSYSLQTDGDKRQVAITEAKTDWDSQALAENYIAPKSADYLALQAQGLTIYMYGDNQASWVNRGNWYRIEGNNHGLSQDQIIKIATSL